MNTVLKKIDELSIKQLYLPFTLLGLLLAAQIQYIQHGWINPDTVLYFESAKLFAIGDWQGAVKIFQWPLYSILIASTHKLTTLDIHTSAQLLSVIFFGIVTASFLKIIELAGGTTRTLFAGALILFSAQYLVGGVLEMLMRDQGFWAFYLTSIVFFIKFYQSRTYLYAFLWQICAIVATLFRVEAISFLILLPTILLFNRKEKWQQRLTALIKCNFINITAAIGIFIALVTNDWSMNQFGRLKEVFTSNLLIELSQKLLTQSAVMSEQVLGKYLEEFAVQGLLLTFIYIIISKAVAATGMVNFGLAAFACRSKTHLINLQVFQVLRAAAIIATINMALIITKVFVLSGRYVIALAFILMIFASFQLGDLFKHFNQSPSPKDKKMRWLTIAILTFMLLGLVKNILPKSDGYNYMQDAVAWVQENNKGNMPVLYNETRLRYYAGEPFIGAWEDNWKVVTTAIQDQTIQKYNFLVITHSSKHHSREEFIAEKLPEFVEVKRFSPSKAKKSVVIYRNIVAD